MWAGDRVDLISNITLLSYLERAVRLLNLTNRRQICKEFFFFGSVLNVPYDRHLRTHAKQRGIPDCEPRGKSICGFGAKIIFPLVFPRILAACYLRKLPGLRYQHLHFISYREFCYLLCCGMPPTC